MSDTAPYVERLNLREQIARIDDLIADVQEKHRKHRMQPWQVAATVFAGGTAFFAAGAASLKLVGG